MLSIALLLTATLAMASPRPSRLNTQPFADSDLPPLSGLSGGYGEDTPLSAYGYAPNAPIPTPTIPGYGPNADMPIPGYADNAPLSGYEDNAPISGYEDNAPIPTPGYLDNADLPTGYLDNAPLPTPGYLDNAPIPTPTVTPIPKKKKCLRRKGETTTVTVTSTVTVTAPCTPTPMPYERNFPGSSPYGGPIPTPSAGGYPPSGFPGDFPGDSMGPFPTPSAGGYPSNDYPPMGPRGGMPPMMGGGEYPPMGPSPSDRFPPSMGGGEFPPMGPRDRFPSPYGETPYGGDMPSPYDSFGPVPTPSSLYPGSSRPYGGDMFGPVPTPSSRYPGPSSPYGGDMFGPIPTPSSRYPGPSSPYGDDSFGPVPTPTFDEDVPPFSGLPPMEHNMPKIPSDYSPRGPAYPAGGDSPFPAPRPEVPAYYGDSYPPMDAPDFGYGDIPPVNSDYPVAPLPVPIPAPTPAPASVKAPCTKHLHQSAAAVPTKAPCTKHLHQSAEAVPTKAPCTKHLHPATPTPAPETAYIPGGNVPSFEDYYAPAPIVTPVPTKAPCTKHLKQTAASTPTPDVVYQYVPQEYYVPSPAMPAPAPVPTKAPCTKHLKHSAAPTPTPDVVYQYVPAVEVPSFTPTGVDSSVPVIPNGYETPVASIPAPVAPAAPESGYLPNTSYDYTAEPVPVFSYLAVPTPTL